MALSQISGARVAQAFAIAPRAPPSPDLQYQSTFVNRCVSTRSEVIMRTWYWPGRSPDRSKPYFHQLGSRSLQDRVGADRSNPIPSFNPSTGPTTPPHLLLRWHSPISYIRKEW